MALSAGTRLGPYEILAPLGAGGMGEVYRARDPRLKRDVALKVLPEEVAQDSERLDRFEREAQTLGALNHPSIVTIYSVEEAEGIRFLTMELVEGKTLTRVIPRGGLPLPRFFKLAVPLAEAVAAAHEKGVIHRDLKPGNVMVTDEDRVKVLDFGLAKLEPEAEEMEGSDAPTAHDTGAGRVMGTAPYMSPEQVEGKAVDHRSDIFSLGIILYEVVTGDRPFQGDTSAAVASSILRDSPSVMEQKADLPRELGRLIKHCLEKDPRKRYQSTLDLANDLEELRREVDSGEARTSSGGSLTAPSGGRRTWLVGAAVVAALALGIGYLQTRSAPEPALAETATPERQRLVVLPFENLGAPEDAYFAAGMTEEITSRLARVSGLGVISRTSATEYDRTGKTMKQVGADLGVGFVLEGTVRWDHQSEGAGRVRITPQLIRVADDTHLWADSYDRVLDDIFEAQSEIAQEVVAQLGVTLLPEEQKNVTARPTESLEAYNLYLQGQFARFGEEETIGTVREAAERFLGATEVDPDFAQAYAALAECYSYLAAYGEVPVGMAEEAVGRALGLDETIPDAHVALGLIRELHRLDWTGAEAAFNRAIELSPDHWNARREYGWLLRRMGRYEEALNQHEQAYRLDPVSTYSAANLAQTYLLVGDVDRAIQIRRRMLELHPERTSLHESLAISLAENGEFEEAFKELERAGFQQSVAQLAAAGYVHALAGRTSEARQYIERSDELDVFDKDWAIAMILVGLGDHEKALDRIERFAKGENGEFAAFSLNASHWAAPLRDDRRYKTILRSIGLEP